MTATQPVPPTDTWAAQLEQLRARYKHVRAPILVALNILLHDPNISVEDAKAQASQHGVKITAASVSAAKRLLERMDEKVVPSPTPTTTGAGPAPQRPPRRLRPADQVVDAEALIRQVVGKIQGQGSAEANGCAERSGRRSRRCRRRWNEPSWHTTCMGPDSAESVSKPGHTPVITTVNNANDRLRCPTCRRSTLFAVLGNGNGAHRVLARLDASGHHERLWCATCKKEVARTAVAKAGRTKPKVAAPATADEALAIANNTILPALEQLIPVADILAAAAQSRMVLDGFRGRDAAEDALVSIGHFIGQSIEQVRRVDAAK